MLSPAKRIDCELEILAKSAGFDWMVFEEVGIHEDKCISLLSGKLKQF